LVFFVLAEVAASSEAVLRISWLDHESYSTHDFCCRVRVRVVSCRVVC
jgi:hypothetical protein